MNMTKAERLAGALNDFLRTSPNAEAAAVVTFDGLTMASALPSEMDEERMGAMSAALLGLGEQAARGLGRGELQQLFVEGTDGYVFLMSARDQAVLAVVTDKDAKIGFVLFEMRRAAHTVGAILAGEPESAPERTTDLAVTDWTYGHPVAHVEERTVAACEVPALVEHEIEWEPGDVDQDPLPVYQPGPISEDLEANPYYLNDLN